MQPTLITVTGGPGAGKTTLVDILADHGFITMAESGRAILQSVDGMNMRESDPFAFAMAMLKRDRENFDRANRSNAKYAFDRGFPDIAGYLNLMDIDIPEQLNDICQQKRYTGPIFAAPPWREIFENDAERTQSFKTACETYDAVTNSWRNYGYKLIILPLAPVEKRIDFILDKIL